MTQANVSTDLTVAALQESVRHNEKNIDKLDRDLKDFRVEVLQQFEKVDQRFIQLETKVDKRFEKVDQQLEKINDRFNQTNMLLITIVGLIVTLIVKLVVFS
ncbi:MAG: hypothetical protein ACO3NK_16930 [Prochlorotrichaceae cyanobacterium]|jgi:exonuclease VII large subunit